MVPARRRGSRHPAMAGRPHLPTMGAPGRPGRRPAATTGRPHRGSRRLAGPVARVSRRVGTDVPVHRATGPAVTQAPLPQARCPVTPGRARRARGPPVRDGERTPARAGGVTRRPPRADRVIPGRMRAGAMRVADASRAPAGAGGPQHPVRSPAGRVTFMLTAVPGVVRGRRPTRHPIVAADAAVTLRCRPVGHCRAVVRCRPVGRCRVVVRFRPAGRAWTAT